MGASGWSYFVPYQADFFIVLQALLDAVFQRSDYYQRDPYWKHMTFEDSLPPGMDEEETAEYLDEFQRLQTLPVLEQLLLLNKPTNGKWEVRLSSAFLSFGTAGFNISKDTGNINVLLYPYKSLGDSPFLMLKKSTDRKWFEHCVRQFELLWADAIVFTPNRLGRNGKIG